MKLDPRNLGRFGAAAPRVVAAVWRPPPFVGVRSLRDPVKPANFSQTKVASKLHGRHDRDARQFLQGKPVAVFGVTKTKAEGRSRFVLSRMVQPFPRAPVGTAVPPPAAAAADARSLSSWRVTSRTEGKNVRIRSPSRLSGAMCGAQHYARWLLHVVAARS